MKKPQQDREAAKLEAAERAENLTNPFLLSSQVLDVIGGDRNSVTLPALMKQLEAQAEEILSSNDSRQIEGILYSQAIVFSQLSNVVAIKIAALQQSDEVALRCQKTMDHLAQLSIKFSEQARRSIATLESIRNPKQTTFVKTKHYVQQQLNQFRETTEVLELEESKHAAMDIPISKEASATDKTVEAVAIQ